MEQRKLIGDYRFYLDIFAREQDKGNFLDQEPMSYEEYKRRYEVENVGSN